VGAREGSVLLLQACLIMCHSAHDAGSGVPCSSETYLTPAKKPHEVPACSALHCHCCSPTPARCCTCRAQLMRSTGSGWPEVQQVTQSGCMGSATAAAAAAAAAAAGTSASAAASLLGYVSKHAAADQLRPAMCGWMGATRCAHALLACQQTSKAACRSPML
jgi:hypothetical protein